MKDDISSGRPPQAQAFARPPPQAVSQLFDHHNQLLVRFLIGRLGNESEAREVAHEAYVQLLQLDRPGAISFLRRYLFRSAAALARERLLRRAQPLRFEDIYRRDAAASQLATDRDMSPLHQAVILRRALLELPALHRRAFLLSRFDELDPIRIARRLDLTEARAERDLRAAAVYCRLRLEGEPERHAKARVFAPSGGVTAESIDSWRLDLAAGWMLRLRDETTGEAEIMRWVEWCESEPQNQLAFERVQSVWRVATGLSREVRDAELMLLPPWHARLSHTLVTAGFRARGWVHDHRRAWLAAVVLLALATGSAATSALAAGAAERSAADAAVRHCGDSSPQGC